MPYKKLLHGAIKLCWRISEKERQNEWLQNAKNPVGACWSLWTGQEPTEALKELLILHWYNSYYHWERNRRTRRAYWSLKAEKCLWNLWPHTKHGVGGSCSYKRDRTAETDPIHTQRQECAESRAREQRQTLEELRSLLKEGFFPALQFFDSVVKWI